MRWPWKRKKKQPPEDAIAITFVSGKEEWFRRVYYYQVADSVFLIQRHPSRFAQAHAVIIPLTAIECIKIERDK